MKEKEERKEPAAVLPPAEFSHIVQTFAVQAFIHLGKLPNPVSDKLEIDLKMAKFNIDLIEILQHKTKGNLTEEEEKLLADLLYAARMLYIDISKGEKNKVE